MVVGAALLGALAWAAAPWIAMARRGTTDQQTVDAWLDVELPLPCPRPAPDDAAPVIPLQRRQPKPAPIRRREGDTAP